jgi:hypothetical protein
VTIKFCLLNNKFCLFTHELKKSVFRGATL